MGRRSGWGALTGAGKVALKIEIHEVMFLVAVIGIDDGIELA